MAIRRNTLIVCITLLAWGVACLGLLLAQSQQPQSKDKDESYTLHVDVDLININVAVTTASGNYLADLKKQNFKIYEDKVEQQITHFAPVDAPFAVALVLDTSMSTEGKLARIQDEAIQFVKQLHPDDEVTVISFDDEVHLETDFTRNRNAIERAIKRTRTGQATQLYEAVYLALQEQLRPRRERKAMVLFTDGVDTTSPTSSAKETIEKAKEADALIYPIFFDTRRDMRRMTGSPYPPTGQPNPRFPVPSRVPVDPRSPRQRDQDDWQIEMEYQRGRAYLQDLAEATGGTLYAAEGLDSLGGAFSKIAHELRSLYSLGYVSTNQKRDGKFRKLTVKVDLPQAIVKAKKGYFSQKK
ncbi:MAG TPA: VWA domain-containing protein [Terriglobia bacterium]|nr:VWA domain-containing protein [Terriglobia bacterium]